MDKKFRKLVPKSKFCKHCVYYKPHGYGTNMVNVPRHPIIHFCSTIDLYCPHFLSIFVCNLFTFRSSPKPHGPLEQNWHECLLGGAFQFWIFSVNQKFNMAAITNSVFWLADISKIFSETTGQIWLWYCRKDD